MDAAIAAHDQRRAAQLGGILHDRNVQNPGHRQPFGLVDPHAVGFLAKTVPGDVIEHLAMLRGLGVEAIEVRTPEDLAQVDALIIPGGESTTIGLANRRCGRWLRRAARSSSSGGQWMRGSTIAIAATLSGCAAA
jgi:hypothetical protein